MKYAGRLISAVAVLIVCLACFAQAKVLPKMAELMPPETGLLIDIPDFNAMMRQVEKTNMYKFYKDPAMAAFVTSLRTKWREKMRSGDSALAKLLAETDLWPSGRVAMFFVLNEQTKDMENPPFLFISQWGENIGKIKEAIDKETEKAIADGAQRQSEDYRGFTIVTMTRQSPARQVPDFENYSREQNSVPTKTFQPQPVKASSCFVDDCLITGTDADTLKFVSAHIDGASSPALAGDSDYAATMGTIGPRRDIDLYFNVKQLVKMLSAEDTTGKTQTTISNLGFDNVACIGCSLAFGASTAGSVAGKAVVKINGSKKGVCKMLEPESGPVAAPRFIPASAYSVMLANLNVRKIWDELYKVIYAINPAGAAWMQVPLIPASPDGEPGLSLKADIIDHLGTGITVAQNTRKPFAAGSMPTETLFAVAVNNRSALEKSLSLFHGKMIAQNNPDARRELLGYTIYVVRPDFPFFRGPATPLQLPSERPEPKVTPMAFTVTDTHLIIGQEAAVERAIRTLGSTEAASVGSARWWTAAKQSIPSSVGMAAFEDSAASMEVMWWMLKESAKTKRSPGMGAAGYMLGQSPFIELADFGLLPEFDVVRRYFGPSAFYGVGRPDGFFFEFKYLNAPAGD
jgi:hypothetical protein